MRRGVWLLLRELTVTPPTIVSVMVGPATRAKPPWVGMNASRWRARTAACTSARTPSKPRWTMDHSNSPTSRASRR